jgi:hypothetical protein
MDILETLRILNMIGSDVDSGASLAELTAAIGNPTPSSKVVEQLSSKLDGGASVTTLNIGQQTCLVFWSRREFCKGVAIFSSRLGRAVRQNQPWFRALMALVRIEIDPSEFLISAPEMTCHRFVERAAERLGRRSVSVWLPKRTKNDWQQWLKKIADNRSPDGIFVSPFFGGDGREIGRDRIVAELAEKLLVFNCARGGNIETLMQEMSASERVGASPKKDIVIVRSGSDESDVDCEAARQWFIVDLPKGTRKRASDECNTSESRSLGQLIFLDEIVELKPLLVHWTRGAHGPWPGQTEQQYVDELLDTACCGAETVRSNPLALLTLTRILQQRRLLGSGATIRAAEKVVCLTSVALEQFPARRVYRRHRGHWDFEPYGIAFSAAAMEGLAKPAIYGNDDTWKELQISQRWRFQSSATLTGDIDWRAEEEWRVAEDLVFEHWDDGVYPFVAGLSDVASVRAVWSGPIIVLEKEGESKAGH